MALKSGRVGVRTDQVDVYGKIVITDGLIEQIRDAMEIPEEIVAPVINPLPVIPNIPIQPLQPVDEINNGNDWSDNTEEPIEEPVEEEVEDEQTSE